MVLLSFYVSARSRALCMCAVVINCPTSSYSLYYLYIFALASVGFGSIFPFLSWKMACVLCYYDTKLIMQIYPLSHFLDYAICEHLSTCSHWRKFMCYQFIKHTHTQKKLMITQLGWHWLLLLLLLLLLPSPQSSYDSLSSHRLALANVWRRNTASTHVSRSKEILETIYQTLKFDPFCNNFQHFPPQLLPHDEQKVERRVNKWGETHFCQANYNVYYGCANDSNLNKDSTDCHTLDHSWLVR